MRITMIAALAVAALGASPCPGGPAPNEATSTTPAAQSQRAEPQAAYAQYRGRYYRGGPRYVGRGYYGRPYYGGRIMAPWLRLRLWRGGGSGVAGLATGAIIGGALAAQPSRPDLCGAERRRRLLRAALPVLRPGERHLPRL